ncbi:MAG: flagellar biosynthesis anti-sigma factor FlgM [Desulfotomaculaceae bacterium]|nr:flagellar biosynthesis anti-sigma factor FlgM [Desulfotomaculaceae bacterium]
MKINWPGGNGTLKTCTDQMKKDNDVQKGQQDGQIIGDSAEISRETMERLTYRSMLGKWPSVRENLVAALKKSIQDGSYQPDSKKIAAGISYRHLNKTRT